MAELLSPTFVGRGRELRELAQGLQAATAGHSSAIVVGGDAGVGKSRLVRQFISDHHQSDVSVLFGTCVDCGESPLPFGPIVEALRRLTAQLDVHTGEQLLKPVQAELHQLLPKLEPLDQPFATPAPGGSRSQLFELILSLLERLSVRQPVMMVIEDLHWSDRSTRDLLAFLVPNLTTARVMVVLTYRTDELVEGHPFRRYIAQLERNDGVARVMLAPFDRAELAAHLRDIAARQPEPGLIDAIWARSQGNPFYAGELLACAEEGDPSRLPENLSDILRGRLKMLSPMTQRLVRLAAAGGPAVDHRLLAAIAGMPDDALYDGLREAIAHQILFTDDGGDCYCFRHVLMQEIAYNDLLPGERRTVHSLYGQWISSNEALATSRRAAELARHYQHAGEPAAALRSSLEAATVAEDVNGFAEASSHYERALVLWAEVDESECPADLRLVALLERCAAANDLAGDHHRAAALVRCALEESVPDDPGVNLLRERLGRYLWAAGESEEALEAYEEAVRHVEGDPPSPERAEILGAHARSLMWASRHRQSLRYAEEALTIARLVGARPDEARALTTLGSNLVVLGDPEAGAAHLYEALRVAEELDDPDDIAMGYRDLASTLSGPLNCLDEALDVATRGVKRVGDLGLERHYGVSLRSIASDTLFRLGRWDEAEMFLSEAMQRAPTGVAALDLYLARVKLAVGRGRFEAATIDLATVSALSVKAIDLRFKVPLSTLDAGLALWEGRLDDARVAVEAGLAHVRETDDVWFVAPLLWHGLRAEAERAQNGRASRRNDDIDDALDHGRVLRQRSRELCASGPQQGAFRVVVDAYDAMCDGEMSRIEGVSAPDTWRAVTDAWDQLGHPYPAAYARWRRAEALLSEPKRSADAVTLLRDAYHATDRMGAVPLRQEVERLAQRARIVLSEDPPPATDGRPAELPATHRLAAEVGLTPREVQVLTLLAEGSTNRQIATTLFISEKTASVHVSNILSKLGVRSRVEAATVLHRLGVLGPA